MKPNPHDETADRAAEERSEDDGMTEHRAKARVPAERGPVRSAMAGIAGVGRRPGGPRIRGRCAPAVGSESQCGRPTREVVVTAPATAPGAVRMVAAPVLALGLDLLSVGPLSGGLVRDADAQQRERETQEEVAPCRIVTGETGVPAGRTTMGACAKAIQAGSGAGTWGPYEFEVDRDGRVRVDGEDLGVIR